MLDGFASQRARAKLAPSFADVLSAATIQLTRQALAFATLAVVDESPAMTDFDGLVPLNNNAGFIHCGNLHMEGSGGTIMTNTHILITYT